MQAGRTAKSADRRHIRPASHNRNTLGNTVVSGEFVADFANCRSEDHLCIVGIEGELSEGHGDKVVQERPDVAASTWSIDIRQCINASPSKPQLPGDFGFVGSGYPVQVKGDLLDRELNGIPVGIKWHGSPPATVSAAFSPFRQWLR